MPEEQENQSATPAGPVRTQRKSSSKKKAQGKRAKISAYIGAAATSIMIAATMTPYAIAAYVRATSNGWIGC